MTGVSGPMHTYKHPAAYCPLRQRPPYAWRGAYVCGQRELALPPCHCAALDGCDHEGIPLLLADTIPGEMMPLLDVLQGAGTPADDPCEGLPAC